MTGDVHLSLAAPAGWTTIDIVNQSTSLTMGVFWHFVVSSDPGPYVFTWTGSQSVAATIIAYQNADQTNPIDGHAGAGFATTPYTAPSVASGVNELQLIAASARATLFCGTISPNNSFSTVTVAQGGGSKIENTVYYTSVNFTTAGAAPATTISCDSQPGVAHQLTLRQQTTAGLACNVGVTMGKISPITLRSYTTGSLVNATTLVMNTPAGVQQNDMLFLTLGWNAGGSPIVPSGWTGIGSLGTFGQSMFTYRRFASASEPASYTWTFSAGSNVVAWEGAYVGVDTVSNADAVGAGGNSGQSTTSHTTKSVTVTGTGDLVIASFYLNAVGTLSTPQGTAAEGAVSVAGPGTLAVFDTYQAYSGAVSAKTTTSSVAAADADTLYTFKPATSNTTTLGTGTATVTSQTGPTLISTGSFATSAATFADGDRLYVLVSAPNDGNCGTKLSFDATTTPSKLTVATIVPEGVAGLLLLAPALPVGLRWWKRRRQ